MQKQPGFYLLRVIGHIGWTRHLDDRRYCYANTWTSGGSVVRNERAVAVLPHNAEICSLGRCGQARRARPGKRRYGVRAGVNAGLRMGDCLPIVDPRGKSRGVRFVPGTNGIPAATQVVPETSDPTRYGARISPGSPGRLLARSGSRSGVRPAWRPAPTPSLTVSGHHRARGRGGADHQRRADFKVFVVFLSQGCSKVTNVCSSTTGWEK